jgi:hypothetical protein
VKLLFLLVAFQVHGQIQFLLTSAMNPLQFEWRKEEYLKSFHSLRAYGYEPWIVEALSDSSFFDEMTHQVLYPQVNNNAWRNKGANETNSIRASIPYLPFNDEDIVIKMTGRYYLYDRHLINLIETMQDQYDAFVCYGKNFVDSDHIFTGCFAMRWKYLKKLINELDLEWAEKEYVAIEKIFAEFIQNNNLRTKITDLHCQARIFFTIGEKDVKEW